MREITLSFGSVLIAEIESAEWRREGLNVPGFDINVRHKRSTLVVTLSDGGTLESVGEEAARDEVALRGAGVPVD